MLEEQIMNDFKQAMKNKEAIRTSTLSLLRSQLKYVLIEKKIEKLADPDVIVVIKKQAKQRQDAIVQYEKGGRPELAEKEKKDDEPSVPSSRRKTAREKNKVQALFGLDLVLKKGDTNNIYLDVLDLYNFYLKDTQKKEPRLSKNFPALIRMSLRLLVESATPKTKGMADYVNANFENAKKQLTKDQKTTLANNSINSAKSLIQLLQSGAHNYANSANFEQTVGMSIIIGAMLNITHSKK